VEEHAVVLEEPMHFHAGLESQQFLEVGFRQLIGPVAFKDNAASIGVSACGATSNLAIVAVFAATHEVTQMATTTAIAMGSVTPLIGTGS
jgi:hypothetical protein